MPAKVKAITPKVLIELADNPEFAATFVMLTKRTKAAPGVAYPCCETQKQTIKAVNYWNRLLCSITRMSAARVRLLKKILDVDKIMVRCKNEGRDRLVVL